MAVFLLVHGSWHGAWCWERLRPRLEERGHHVRAIDLPAHGEDPTPAWRATAGGYSAAIRDAASACDDKPIVVGHSMGGLAITRAASDDPALFAELVYLCAFVPLGWIALPRLVRGDRESLVRTGLQARFRGAVIRSDRARSIFYGDCSDADAAWAIERLCPDPWVSVPGMLRRRRIGLPTTYIECTRDCAISIGLQRTMAARAGIHKTMTLETDHSPFLSAPAELAERLDDIARGRLGD